MDITMCPSTTCRRRETCRRNQASGTKPGDKQSWALIDDDQRGKPCCGYWPAMVATEREEMGE